MLRHVVSLRLDDEVSPETVELIATELRALPDRVESIRTYTVGVDLGLATDNAQISVIAEFDDEAGFASYRDHPDHVSLIDALIRPILVTRLATQYATP